MNLKHFTSILSCFVILASCSNKNKESNYIPDTYYLKKTHSITLSDSNPIFGKFYEHFIITEDGSHMIFADKMLDQIFVYQSDGNFLKVIGERNKGPKGIVELSSYYVSPESHITIYDAAQRLLKTFDLEGNLIRSINFLKNSTISAFKLDWNNEKILASIIENEYVTDPYSSKQLAVIDATGKIDTIFGKYDPFILENNNYSFLNEIVIDDEENTIYTNLQYSPYIQVYDLNSYEQIAYFGKKTESFRIPDKELFIGLPISEINKRAKNTSAVVGIYLTECCIIQHLQILTKEWFETADYTTKKNLLVIYDKMTRKFITEIPIDFALGTVHQNKLYFIEDLNPDNYTLGVYELVKNEK